MLFVDRSGQKKGYSYEQPMELIMMKDLRTGRVK